MKNISLTSRRRSSEPLHIEAPGCIINIYTRLSDSAGREVTTVEVLVDGDRYAGEPEWWVDGVRGARAPNIRVVKIGE